MSPYNKCTFNKVINDHQCTIQFHVNDLMVTHHDKQVIDDIFEKLDEQFGTVRKMSVEHGPVVEYLGMLIDFSKDGRKIFFMIDYVEDILAECANYDMDGTAVWPAHEDSFKINENAVVIFFTVLLQSFHLRPNRRSQISSWLYFSYVQE